MWKKITAFLSSEAGGGKQDQKTQEELRLATAALLYRAGNIDGHISEIELTKLKKILKCHFELSDTELTDLMAAAKKDEKDAVDLYGYTKIITELPDQNGRIAVVELIWEVILADDVIDEYEANLVWRVAELIGVSARDRILLKQKVMQARQ